MMRSLCRIMFGFVAAAVFLFVYSHAVMGQTGAATLSGIVTDEGGAIVPNCEIQLQSVARGNVITTKTNNDGIYVFTAVQPGSYNITIRRNGFKQVDFLNLLLNTQDHVQQNFRLQVGSVSESVTVNANAEHMETDNPAVGLLVSQDFVENMPLNGRSVQDLLALAPGAVSAVSGSGLYSINGQRENANTFRVDGVQAPSNPGWGSGLGGFGGQAASGSAPAQTSLGTTQNLVAVDDIQEFTIETSGYAAEFGRQPGGQVQFTTRSGGNEFHASLYDYFRNEALDANSYFFNYSRIPRQPERQNDFGGTFGGPIRIPHIYNGKDRTFFFFSYEGLRLRIPSSVLENDPTISFRQSAAVGVQPFLNAYPIPNGPSNNDGATAQFSAGYAAPANIDAVSIRVDHVFTQTVQAFVRYSDTPSNTSSFQDFWERQIVKTRAGTAGLTLQISPHLHDELRVNYSTTSLTTSSSTSTLGGAVPWSIDLIVPQQYAGEGRGVFVLGLPNIAPVNQLQIGQLGTTQQHQFNLVDGLSWVRGSHTFKFGGDWRRLSSALLLYPYESYFDIQSLSGIQQGYADSAFIISYQKAYPIFNNLSLFAQDHWRVSGRFTVDAGLRWEFNPVPGASHGVYPVAVNQTNDLATMMLAPTGSPLYSTRYDNFAPRLGFAYQINPSSQHAMTVRGGGGVFYDTGQNLAATAYSSYPYSNFNALTNVPLPAPASALVPPSPGVPLTPPYGNLIGLSDPHIRLPYTEVWNLSLDQQITKNNILTLSYVGNEGRRLLYQETYNNLSSVNPDFTFAQITRSDAASNYNALQIQDQGYVSSGLQVIASYTWAHARDDVSSDTPALPPTWGNSDNDVRQVLNVAMNYEIPKGDARSVILRSLSRGWLFANRLTVQSGFPIDIYQGSYTLNNGVTENIRPNLVPGQPIYLRGSVSSVNGLPVPGAWRLNPNAFSPVQTDPITGMPLEIGTLGRNYLHGPAFWSLNTAIQRSFQLGEQLTLRFRIEAFNILNHPNFYSVYGFLPASNFGQLNPLFPTELGAGAPTVTGATYGTGAARSLQLSLRLQF